jgi:long-subunit fatty acid transport protein
LTGVFNVAVGVEHEFSEKLTAYGSFRTDLSGIDPDSGTIVPVGDWDIYHIAGGTTMTVGRSEFTLGAIVGKGSSTTSGIFEPIGEDSPQMKDPVKLEYFRIAFILGFNFAFN